MDDCNLRGAAKSENVEVQTPDVKKTAEIDRLDQKKLSRIIRKTFPAQKCEDTAACDVTVRLTAGLPRVLEIVAEWKSQLLEPMEMAKGGRAKVRSR